MCLFFLFERSWFIPLMIWNHLGNIWQQKLWSLVKKMQLPGWAAFTGDTALTWGGTFSLKSLAAELVSGYRYILREGRSLSSTVYHWGAPHSPVAWSKSVTTSMAMVELTGSQTKDMSVGKGLVRWRVLMMVGGRSKGAGMRANRM